MPFLPTSKLQVSGYKYLVARLHHALTRHDTRMQLDPRRSTGMSQIAGVALTAVVLLGCAALAYFKPQGLRDNSRIVQARDSSQLFVTIDNKMHPVLNLVSAQLIVGSPEQAVQVKPQEVQQMPRGQLVGIAGAPEHVFQPAGTDSVWAVCDVIDHPGTALPSTHTAVIAGDQQASVAADPSAARIVQGPDQATWLLNNGMRRRIDVNDAALVLGLGLQRFPGIDVISSALFNAIPAGRPIASPVIAGSGSPPPYPIGGGAVIGSVLRVPQAGSVNWYVVLAEGVQQIPEVMASVIRNTDAFGAAVPATVAQDVIARMPAAAPGLDTTMFPDKPLHAATSLAAPVTCWQWRKNAGEQQSASRVAFTAALPLTEEQRRLWRHDLVSRPTVSMYAAPGSGFYAQTTGSNPRSPATETRWWVSDRGVRYGLVEEGPGGSGTSAPAALGLKSPLPAPWSALEILAAGPGLSQQAALVAQDTVPPAPLAVALNEGAAAR